MKVLGEGGGGVIVVASRCENDVGRRRWEAGAETEAESPLLRLEEGEVALIHDTLCEKANSKHNFKGFLQKISIDIFYSQP